MPMRERIAIDVMEFVYVSRRPGPAPAVDHAAYRAVGRVEHAALIPPPGASDQRLGEGRGAVWDRGPRHPGCPDAHGEGRRRDRRQWRVSPVRATAATAGHSGCAHLTPHPAVAVGMGEGDGT